MQSSSERLGVRLEDWPFGVYSFPYTLDYLFGLDVVYLPRPPRRFLQAEHVFVARS
jgi:hypothetical protein